MKTKLLIYLSIYVPALTYGHELKRMRSQVTIVSFLGRVVGLNLRDIMRSLDIQKELGVESQLLCMERNQLIWVRHLIRMPPGYVSLEVFWRFFHRVELSGGITYLI